MKPEGAWDEGEPHVRAVVATRVSVWSEDNGSVSPERQSQQGRRYAEANAWSVVGDVADLDVSASIPPRERPDLGPWLTEKHDEWDAMIFTKVDRAFRSVRDCIEIAEWAEKEKKILVFCDDGIKLDYLTKDAGFGNEMARIFLTLAAMFGEIERKRIVSRVKDSYAKRRLMPRWTGGIPPFGYMSVDAPDGGRTLAIDPESSQYVVKMVELYLDDHSLWSIADLFTAKGIPTPSVYHRARIGGAAKDTKNTWTPTQITQILRNPAITGLKNEKVTVKNADGEDVRENRVIFDDEGQPVRIADPIIDSQTWEKLQETLTKGSFRQRPTKNSGELLGIAHCADCGSRMHLTTQRRHGREYRYLRCGDARNCKSHGTFSVDAMKTYLEEYASESLAQFPVVSRVWVEGSNAALALENIEKRMKELRDDRDAGLFEDDEDDYRLRMKKFIARKKELQEEPQQPSHWVETPTGETLADAFKRMDWPSRRTLLLDHGFRFYLAGSTRNFVGVLARDGMSREAAVETVLRSVS